MTLLLKESLEERILRIADELQPDIQATFLEAVDALKRNVPIGQLTDLLDEGDLAGALEALADITLTPEDLAPIRDAIRRTSVGAAEAVAAEFGLSFTAVNERAVAFATAQAAQLVTNIDSDTLTAIRGFIIQGQQGTLGVREQARQIRTVIGLDNRSAAAVNRFYLGALESGMTRPQARVAAERLSARHLARRADNIARTETIRAANMGTEIGWIEARDKGLLPQSAVKVWIATEDSRTCFPAGVQVATPNGSKPIQRIQPGDLVETPLGPKPVAGTTTRLYDGEWTAVLDREGQLTVSTSDHLWWSNGWREAHQLKVGDRLQTVQNKSVEILGIANFTLGDTHNLPAVFTQLGILPSVLDWIMPVVPVNLQSDIPNSEIDGHTSNLEFLDVANVHPVEGFSDDSFDTGFAFEPSVTGERTESTIGVPGLFAEPDTTRITVNENGRASAFFGTMLPVALGVESSPAGGTVAVDDVDIPACGGTPVVSVLDRPRYAETLIAYRTDLLDRLKGTVGEITVPTAKPSPSEVMSFAGSESDSTVFTNDRVRVDTGLQVVTVGGTETPASLKALWSDERFIAAVTPVLKAFTHWFSSHIDGCYPVYDLAVTDIPVFYANDRLVHNCPICALLDGKQVEIGGSFDIQERAESFTVDGGTITVQSTVPLKRPSTTRTPPSHQSCRCTLGIELA